jgi:hypothetical protein
MGYDGVGFAPLPDFGYTYLDCDNCVDVAGNMPAEIGIIDLDFSLKNIAFFAVRYSLHQLVVHQPGGRIRLTR